MICAVAVTTTGRIILKQNPGFDKYRYISCFMMGVMFIGLLCLSKCDVVYTFGTIIVTVFIIYCEVKLIILASLFISIPTYTMIVVNFVRNITLAGRPIDYGDMVGQFGGCTAGICGFIGVTIISKTLNDEKIRRIENINKKNK